MLTGSIRNLLCGFILLFILQRLHPLPVKNDFYYNYTISDGNTFHLPFDYITDSKLDYGLW